MAVRMKIGADVKSQLLVMPHHCDRYNVAGRNVKCSIKHILDSGYFFASKLQQNVSRFDADLSGGRVLNHLRDFHSGTVRGVGRLRKLVHPDPAMPKFTETDEVAANFLGSFDRHSVTG